MKKDTPTTSAHAKSGCTHYNITTPPTKRSTNYVLPDLRHSQQQNNCHLPDAGSCLRFSTTLRGRRESTPRDPTHLQGRAPAKKTGIVPPLLASLRQTSRSRHDNWRRPTTRDYPHSRSRRPSTSTLHSYSALMQNVRSCVII